MLLAQVGQAGADQTETTLEQTSTAIVTTHSPFWRRYSPFTIKTKIKTKTLHNYSIDDIYQKAENFKRRLLLPVPMIR